MRIDCGQGVNEIPEHHGRKSIYIAVGGVVFDMTSGGDFYGPGTSILLFFVMLGMRIVLIFCAIVHPSYNIRARCMAVVSAFALFPSDARCRAQMQEVLTRCLLAEMRLGGSRP